MNVKPLILMLLLAVAPAWGQSVYKCPQPDGPPKYQQQPCTITGDGEKMDVKPIPTGAGAGLSDAAKDYLQEQEKARQNVQKSTTTARSGEVEKECMDMRRRIMRLEERENRGIHTWSKHGYEESNYLKKEYETLCGSW